jgi:hypothetical protein
LPEFGVRQAQHGGDADIVSLKDHDIGLPVEDFVIRDADEPRAPLMSEQEA